jgi:hypothetical protein
MRFGVLVAVAVAVGGSTAAAQVKLESDCQAGVQAACADLARGGANIEVRLGAVRKITDQALLSDLARKCSDGQVRLAAIRSLIDQDALARVARENKSAVDRAAAAERLTDQALVARIAREDSSKWVRRKAASFLTDEAEIAKLVTEVRRELLPSVTIGGGLKHVTVDGKDVGDSLLGMVTILPGTHTVTAEFSVLENVTWESGSQPAAELHARLGTSYLLEAEIGIVHWDYMSPKTRHGSSTWKLVVKEEVSSGPGLLTQLIRRQP